MREFFNFVGNAFTLLPVIAYAQLDRENKIVQQFLFLKHLFRHDPTCAIYILQSYFGHHRIVDDIGWIAIDTFFFKPTTDTNERSTRDIRCCPLWQHIKRLPSLTALLSCTTHTRKATETTIDKLNKALCRGHLSARFTHSLNLRKDFKELIFKFFSLFN